MNSKIQFRIFTIVDLDKEEEYLHEMHLKGWRYRANRFGFFYFDQCQSDDVIYRIYDSRFFKKYKHELQDFRNSGWELIETGFCWLKQYNWETTAHKTIEYIDSLLKK